MQLDCDRSIRLRLRRQDYEETSGQLVSKMVDCYHNQNLIRLQDCLVFKEEEEYLKRMYQFGEYSNKVTALSEYYKYHFEAPRLFMCDTYRTIQSYVSDRRDLEYHKVTRMLDGNQKQKEVKSSRSTTSKKLLQNIQVSYVDFENKGNDNGNKTREIKSKKVSFKPGKLPIPEVNILSRQKSNINVAADSKKITRQVSSNTLSRTKSRKQLASQNHLPHKITMHPQIFIKRSLGIKESQLVQAKTRPDPLRQIDLKQKPKTALNKCRSSAMLKNCCVKQLGTSKNGHKVPNDQSVPDARVQVKPLTGRKGSIQDVHSHRNDKENFQFSNKFRNSLQNILFKSKKPSK